MVTLEEGFEGMTAKPKCSVLTQLYTKQNALQVFYWHVLNNVVYNVKSFRVVGVLLG